MKRFASYLSLTVFLPVSLIALISGDALDGPRSAKPLVPGDSIRQADDEDPPDIPVDDPPGFTLDGWNRSTTVSTRIGDASWSLAPAPIATLVRVLFTRIHPKNGPPASSIA